MRIGIGYDVHKLVPGRPLMLGGVHVPFSKGLLGHSDGDALIHAIVDALLGPSGLGDMGAQFPSSASQYQDAPSMTFLQRVCELLGESGWRVINVDATIVAESPMLGLYIQSMREQVARGLGTGVGQVTIKAKTNDGLGFLGAKDGMAAWAVALLQEPS